MINFGTEYLFLNAAVSNLSVDTVAIDSSNFIVSYQKASDHYPYCKIGSISGGVITYGAETQANIQFGQYNALALLDSTHFVMASRQTFNDGQVVIGIISGNSISFGTIVNFYVGDCSYIDVTALDATHFVVICSSNDVNQHGRAKVGTVSGGSTITLGASYEFYNNSAFYCTIDTIDSTHVVIVYDDAISGLGRAKIGTVDLGAQQITYGSPYTFSNTGSSYTYTKMIDSSHFAVAYGDGSNNGTAVIGTISSVDHISFGSNYIYDSSGLAINNSIGVFNSSHFVISFIDASGIGKAIVSTISSIDHLTYEAAVTFSAATIEDSAMYMLDAFHLVISFRDDSNATKGTNIIGSYTPSSTGNFLAFF
jgi:hypothetical protein